MDKAQPIVDVTTRIRDALDLRGMRQVDLVEKTGLSKGLVNQYIHGKVRTIKSDKIYIIAKALDVNPTWLMGYDVPMERVKADKTDLISDVRLLKYMELISDMPETDKQFIYQLIDKMVGAHHA